MHFIKKRTSCNSSHMDTGRTVIQQTVPTKWQGILNLLILCSQRVKRCLHIVTMLVHDSKHTHPQSLHYMRLGLCFQINY